MTPSNDRTDERAADTQSAFRPRVSRTHLALFVQDPEASARWYEDVLGMVVSARGECWTMMSFGAKHHDIALIRADTGAAAGADIGSLRGPINMQHYGMEIEGGLTALRRLYGRLLRKQVPIVKITDHMVGIGVYFTDPDGHRLEFFSEQITDDEEAKRVFKAHNAPSEPISLEPLFD